MAEAIRVIVIQDGEVFIAQCLEVDVAAQGSSREEAFRRLKAVMSAEAKAAADLGRSLFDLGPAPTRFNRELYT